MKDKELDDWSKQNKIDKMWQYEFPGYDKNIKEFQAILEKLDGQKQKPYNFENQFFCHLQQILDLKIDKYVC